MIKLQSLFGKLARPQVNQPALCLNEDSLLRIKGALLLKTWTVYRKELDGIAYPITDNEVEEFIFLPNNKVHHQFFNHKSNESCEEMMVWDIAQPYTSGGYNTVLRMNGKEYRIVSTRDNFMVWVIDGLFLYLRPAYQLRD